MGDETPTPVCEHCGEGGDIRVIPGHGWLPDELQCKPCFTRHDGENEFLDYPQAKGTTPC